MPIAVPVHQLRDDQRGHIVTPDEPPLPGTHVDHFIDSFRADKYARWVLSYFRLPADQIEAFAPFMAKHELYCTYRGERRRVIGASPHGNIWLSANFENHWRGRSEARVNLCSNWGMLP